MSLPKGITKERARYIEDELGLIWRQLSEFAKELDAAAEFQLLAVVKAAASKVWSARAQVQTRAHFIEAKAGEVAS